MSNNTPTAAEGIADAQIGAAVEAINVKCLECGSEDTETFYAEYYDEGNVLHCYDCGADEQL